MAVGLHHTGGLTVAQLRQQIQGLTSPAFRATLVQNLAEEARTQVANGFREERDPYGKDWEPLKSREGKILQKTGRMAASVATAQVGSDGFRLEITATYAVFHQKGATIKPHQRKGGTLAQNRRGRIISKRKAAQTKNKSVRFSSFASYTHGGGVLPQRQMIPDASTGGIGPIWTKAFNEVTDDAVHRQMGRN